MADAEPDLPVDPDVSPFDVETPVAAERTWDLLLAIAAGGAIGGAGRHLLDVVVPDALFPWSTFVENVLGCFLLGALMVYLLDVWSPGRYTRPFLAVGVMGGFTTYSAYTSQARHLLLDGHAPIGVVYLFASVAAGVFALWLGIVVARALSGDRVREKRS